ncbi:basal body-orientation factor 1-like isoform X2 [Carcharodon carcharias]|uniref:basal body-orientation factor 1-like isoform X2 n=1 Tax=Carcharodon carcharias TaxID=13397 RepID=UPI001B7E2FF5|nr:basal body-orientation factor 1-like isoform X2 [Carcharodon carcharias]
MLEIYSRKGNKDEKGDPKIAMESDAEKAMANAALWESRLNTLERSRVQYRDTARTLARTNETLMNDRFQVEKDAIEVISYLKKQDLEKEAMISKLQQQIVDQKQQAIEDNKKMVETHTQQMEQLQNKMWQKTKEIQLIQDELNRVKEFRKKQVFLENELDDIKDMMETANKEHKESLRQLESKFFEEKVRLEREAEQSLTQLTEQAHTEAIMNLSERTRCVFKENIRLHEMVKIYKIDEEQMKKSQKILKEKSTQLASEKETNELLVKEKVSNSMQQRKMINELKKKVENLEKALGHMASEFEAEKQEIKRETKIKMATDKVEIARLQAVIKLKDREMNRVKKLAKNILDQRTEVELFFLQALDEVRQQIFHSRAHYKQAAQIAYQKLMLKASTGKEDYPKIRTFNKSEHSTNCVYQDMEYADKCTQIGKVNISDLTWEQKEKVLRLLFAKMNGLKTNSPKRKQLAENVESTKEPEKASTQDENYNPTFITQAPVEPELSHVSSLSGHQLTKEVILPDIMSK